MGLDSIDELFLAVNSNVEQNGVKHRAALSILQFSSKG